MSKRTPFFVLAAGALALVAVIAFQNGSFTPINPTQAVTSQPQASVSESVPSRALPISARWWIRQGRR